MEPVGFPFNNLYFVIDPFQFTGMNRVVTMIDNTITISLQHFYKCIYCTNV